MAEQLAVPEALAGERLDRAVALLTGWTRREVQDLVEAGAVLVDGERVPQEPQARGRQRDRAPRRAGGRGPARGRRRGRGGGAATRTTTSWWWPNPRASSCTPVPVIPTAPWSTACSPVTPRSPTSATRPVPGSCTGSTATPAGCSSWRARRPPTTVWSRCSPPTTSNVATTRWCGGSRRRRAA